jgi:multidrug efflux system membrane fusion protein
MPVPSPISRSSHPPAAVALALAAVIGSGCARGAQQRRGEAAPVPVTLAQAVRKTVAVYLRAIGQVEPVSAVAVRSRASGELQKVHFEEGQFVREGQLLFTIDPRPARAALSQAEAQLARDRAQLNQAEADVARYAKLVAQDFVTKQQYDQAETMVSTARALVAADEAAADNARLELAYATIAAPVSGRSGNLQVKQGNLVQANGAILVTVNQTRPIYASFAVPVQYLPAIRARQLKAVRVEAVPAQTSIEPAQGTLTFIDNAVDTATSTILLKATFPNEDEKLWPGQFVDVTLTLGEESNRVVVPSGAVQTGQQGTYVYVVDSEQKVELRAVKVARQDAAEAVIDQGLQGDETVVTDGQLRLVPGSKVQPRPPVGSQNGEGKDRKGEARAGAEKAS